MMNNSNWTGRAPRTMEQAFGPYARATRKDRSSSHLWIAAALLCVAVGYMLLVG